MDGFGEEAIVALAAAKRGQGGLFEVTQSQSQTWVRGRMQARRQKTTTEEKANVQGTDKDSHFDYGAVE